MANDISLFAINGISPPSCVSNSCIPEIISFTKPRLFHTAFRIAVGIPCVTKIWAMFLDILIILSIFKCLIYVRVLHYSYYSVTFVCPLSSSVSPIRLMVGNTTG